MSRNGGRSKAHASAPHGRWQQLALALGGILGSGWLIAIPKTGGLTLEPVLLWLLGALSMGLIASVVVRLAQADQRPGGLAWWPTYTSGLVAGTLVNAGLFVVYAGNPPSGSAGAVAALSRTSGWNLCADETGGAVPCVSSVGLNTSGWLLALALLTALFLLHLIGLRLMLWLNIALSTLKAVLLVVLVIVAATAPFQLFAGESSDQFSSLPAALAGGTAVGIIFAFNGFQGPVDHGAPEGKEHRRFAIYGALIIATVLYLALQLTFLAGHGSTEPPEGFRHVLLVTATVLSPLANALLFITLAVIVLRTSVKQGVLELSIKKRPDGTGAGVHRRIFLVIYLFGVLYLFLSRQEWAEISESKSVIYAFVYSYAAVSYEALRRMGKFKDPSYLHDRPSVLAPAGFVVATAIIYYAAFPSLLWGCALIGVIGVLMFLSKLWTSRKRDWAPHLAGARWLFGYLGLLLVLSGTKFVVQAMAAEVPLGDLGKLFALLSGAEELPLSSRDKISPVMFTHVLGVVAAVAGLVYYYTAVRESVRFLEFKERAVF